MEPIALCSEACLSLDDFICSNKYSMSGLYILKQGYELDVPRYRYLPWHELSIFLHKIHLGEDADVRYFEHNHCGESCQTTRDELWCVDNELWVKTISEGCKVKWVPQKNNEHAANIESPTLQLLCHVFHHRDMGVELHLPWKQKNGLKMELHWKMSTRAVNEPVIVVTIAKGFFEPFNVLGEVFHAEHEPAIRSMSQLLNHLRNRNQVADVWNRNSAIKKKKRDKPAVGS